MFLIVESYKGLTTKAKREAVLLAEQLTFKGGLSYSFLIKTNKFLRFIRQLHTLQDWIHIVYM
jgi:hypothetical protein